MANKNSKKNLKVVKDTPTIEKVDKKKMDSHIKERLAPVLSSLQIHEIVYSGPVGTDKIVCKLRDYGLQVELSDVKECVDALMESLQFLQNKYSDEETGLDWFYSDGDEDPMFGALDLAPMRRADSLKYLAIESLKYELLAPIAKEMLSIKQTRLLQYDPSLNDSELPN